MASQLEGLGRSQLGNSVTAGRFRVRRAGEQGHYDQGLELYLLCSRKKFSIFENLKNRAEAKKPVDERLQAQLFSRKALLTEYSRVPELNPHAPSFVPVIRQITFSKMTVFRFLTAPHMFP